MQKLKQNFPWLGLLFSIPFLGTIYKFLNHGEGGAYSLVTDLDRSIPFLKVFILPYIGWYAFIFLTLIYFCFKDRSTYLKTIIALNLALIISYMIYFFYQTTVPRPELAGNDIFTQMVSYIYSTDAPYNCFPSIHSLTSYLMIKAISNSSVKNLLNSLIIKGTAILIIVSTLFVKQHVILDAVSASVLGEITFNFVNNFNRERVALWLMKPYSLLMTKKKSETSWKSI